MFERYTEKARRVIFFARYEASQFGSSTIESEHLLLGLLREDKATASHFLKTPEAMDDIRGQLKPPVSPPKSTSVDIQLSHESKRILAYGAEESERLNHKYIGPPHLLLGVLREEGSLAAKLLAERGVRLAAARQDVAAGLVDVPESVSRTPRFAPPQSLLALLSEREQAGEITVTTGETVAGHFVDIAVFARSEEPSPSTHAGKIARLRHQIRNLIGDMETAIAKHEFGEARRLSDEERRLRQELAREQQEVPAGAVPDPAPFLCILLFADVSLTRLRDRIDAFFKHGVAHVWMFDQADKRVYTASPAEGLREFTGDVLRIEQPALEFDRRQL